MSSPVSTPPRVLLADDQPDVLEALRLLLGQEGFETSSVTTPDAVLGALDGGRYDVLLMDLNYTRDTTSGREGLDLLSRIQQRHKSLPVVVMTGWGSVEVAVEAMRVGVRDVVQKPWDNARLVATLAREAEEGRLRRRVDRDLEEAQAIQHRLLPESFPAVEGWRLEGAWHPASGSSVGGDFFDAIGFGRHHAGVAVADVVGKGLPAALLMSNLQAAVRAFASKDTPPRTLCAQVNRLLCPNMGAGRFISFFYGLLDAAHGRFTYCNAGHVAPILLGADGCVTRLTEGGVVLGVFCDWTYEEAQIAVAPGDRLVLFTDGITEAGPEAGREFGDARLLEVLQEARALDAPAVKTRVLDAVHAFAGDAPHDDMTLIVIAADPR